MKISALTVAFQACALDIACQLLSEVTNKPYEYCFEQINSLTEQRFKTMDSEDLRQFVAEVQAKRKI